jgi:hypothetical protein
VETEQAKIYHHHTPRQYLLPWADADERIAWLGYGKVARSGLTVVGGENDFYRLKDLTDDDVTSIRKLIAEMPEMGRAGHEEFLSAYILPTRLKRLLEQRGVDRRGGEVLDGQEEPSAMKQIDVSISNLNENYHASIENQFWPYLEAIKKRDFSFYDDPLKAGEFFHGLSVQYLRTKTVRDRIRQNVKGLFEDTERVWDVLSHIYGVVMGASLLLNRREFQIFVLDNDTQVPFITSDQPIINMLAETGDIKPPKKMELYYPLSPTQAMLYLNKSTPTTGINRAVSIDEAHRYNSTMIAHSGLQIFSNSEEYLRFVKQCSDAKG